MVILFSNALNCLHHLDPGPRVRRAALFQTEKAWVAECKRDCTFLTSGLYKIQDGGQERCAVCEFAKNSV